MARHERQFFDGFMLVLGIMLGAFAGLFVLTRFVTMDGGTVVQQNSAEQEAILARIEPVGRVVLRGEEQQTAVAEPATPEPVATTLSGPQVYNTACHVCHAPPGIGGAPPLGDDGWQARIEQGMDVLYDNALNGYQGEAGYMPPKGGRVDLSDEEIRAAVDFMIEEAEQ